MKRDKAPLYLIDAYGLIYRSYFAFISRPLRNAKGENVSAVFGFMRSLVALIDQGAPDANGGVSKPALLAAVFDSVGPTFRHEQYPEYKATRQKTSEELHAQVPVIEAALKALGIPMLRAEGLEADDLIATLADRCKADGRDCYILSADKDLLQLVGDGTYALRPGKAGAIYEFVGPREVKTEWGVEPKAVLEVLSLTGDSSDNVPGVPGIGDKTATKLVARYGTLDAIYENIAGIEGAVGKKLAAGKEMGYFSRSLIELRRDAPIPQIAETGLDAFDIGSLNRAAGARALLEAGVRQVAVSLDGATVRELETASGSSESETAEPADAVPPPPRSSAATDAAPPRPVATDALRAKGAYRTILDLNDLDDYLARAKETGLLALDFETDGLEAWFARPFGFSLSVRPLEGVYVPVAPHGPDGSPYLDPSGARERLGRILADPRMTVVAHNAKYDYEVARAWGLPRWQCRIWDTMIASWLTDPERSSHSLDSLIISWLGIETTPFDSIVPKGAVFGTVPLATATAYAAEDVDYALRAKTLLEVSLAAAKLDSLFVDIEMPLLPILAEMEGAGIRLEAEPLREYGSELAAHLVDIEAEIYRLVGHPFNISSTKQLQEVLFVERGLKTGKKTKTGFSTDVGVLEELAREDPVPAKILRYRTLAKLKSTYVDALAGLVGEDGRLRTHFVQTGTATGRVASKDPNLQNIPIRDEEGRRIRAAFVAEPGKVLISADYSQIELVVLAHLSGDENLLEAFRAGRDIHRRTAALIFGLDEDAVQSDQRRIAKTINFGVIYGMSAFRLANELGIPRVQAQEFIDAYFRTYAGVRTFVQQVIADAERDGYVTTLLGRRRYIVAINSKNKTEKAAAERVAVNTPIQGSAADIVKLAMLKLDASLRASNKDARMLLQVHDELIVECAEDDAEAVMDLIRREMESTVTLRAPLRVGVEKARSWGDMH